MAGQVVGFPVDVAAHDAQWPKRSQLLYYGKVAHVARVPNLVAGIEMSENLGVQIRVCIGEESNSGHKR